MSNVELYCKVQNVVMGCRTEEQLKVAKQYVRLAEKVLTHEWNLDVIQLLLAKEKELYSR